MDTERVESGVEHEADVLRFVEEVATAFEGVGLVRMSGRIIGWLLVCEPREQTFTQIADGLQASRGTISSCLKSLVASGWVDRLRVPGERSDHFCLRPGGWVRLSRARNTHCAELTALAGQGLELLADAPPRRLDRLRELRAFHSWLDGELPVLWERWERSRERPSAQDG